MSPEYCIILYSLSNQSHVEVAIDTSSGGMYKDYVFFHDGLPIQSITVNWILRYRYFRYYARLIYENGFDLTKTISKSFSSPDIYHVILNFASYELKSKFPYANKTIIVRPNEAKTTHAMLTTENRFSEINFLLEKYDMSNNSFLSNVEFVSDILQSVYDFNDCLSNCSNRGLCVLSEDRTFKCSCDKNYVGKSCETDSRPCSHKPCLNNATCVDSNSNDFTCLCTEYYEGSRCENQIDLCKNETCSGNGNCIIKSDYKTKCECFKYFNGEKCSIEEEQLKTIKSVISTASVIAIFMIIVTYLFVFMLDVLKYVQLKY